jgi:3-oxoadipate enol-lactonase
MWAKQLPPLAERYRVVNVDYRGHGRSGAATDPFGLDDLVADVVAVLDRLGIEEAVWAGLSIGGMVSLHAALAVPERVVGLILLDTHAGAERWSKKLKYRAMSLGVRVLGVRPFLSEVVGLMFGETTRREKPELAAEWRERFAATHVPSMLRTVELLNARESVVERLGEIQLPALVAVGEEDHLLPPVDAREIAEGLPDASLVVIPGAGHLSALEQPEAVTAAMLGFLDRLPEWGSGSAPAAPEGNPVHSG